LRTQWSTKRRERDCRTENQQSGAGRGKRVTKKS
jgi:hypothetical protein